MTLCAKQPLLPELAHGGEQQRELRGCLQQNEARWRCRKPSCIYSPIPSLINIKSNKKKNAGAREDTQKTHAKANKCLFSRGRELERATISPSYLSLAALAPNECSPTLGHIPFVLYQFFWTAERYWASLITESIWISNQTWTPHPYFQLGRLHIFSRCFVCLYMSNGGKTVGNKKNISP